MSDDLAQRLRRFSTFTTNPILVWDAADRIEALEAENVALICHDPNRCSVFEYMRDADGTVTACRTVTTTAWRDLSAAGAPGFDAGPQEDEDAEGGDDGFHVVDGT